MLLRALATLRLSLLGEEGSGNSTTPLRKRKGKKKHPPRFELRRTLEAWTARTYLWAHVRLAGVAAGGRVEGERGCSLRVREAPQRLRGANDVFREGGGGCESHGNSSGVRTRTNIRTERKQKKRPPRRNQSISRPPWPHPGALPGEARVARWTYTLPGATQAPDSHAAPRSAPRSSARKETSVA